MVAAGPPQSPGNLVLRVALNRHAVLIRPNPTAGEIASLQKSCARRQALWPIRQQVSSKEINNLWQISNMSWKNLLATNRSNV